jgi:hypothetical protein
VWRVNRALSEASTRLPFRDRTSQRLIEQPEESRSRTLNNEPSPRGKPVFISYFSLQSFNFVHQACLDFKFVFIIAFSK